MRSWVRWVVRKTGYYIQVFGEHLWDWGMADIYREEGVDP